MQNECIMLIIIKWTKPMDCARVTFPKTEQCQGSKMDAIKPYLTTATAFWCRQMNAERIGTKLFKV